MDKETIMARLFITPREIDFISDITKEITKDVIGQVIYYYKVRVDLADVHDVYDEMLDRVFDPPVEIDARVTWNPGDTRQDRFGHETTQKVEVYVHFRDMIDRGIKIQEGDFFSFGGVFYEISTLRQDKIIFGQVEHISGYILSGIQARKGLINKAVNGPTSEAYSDASAQQAVFKQQRGNAGMGDRRELVSDSVLDSPIGPAQTVKPAVAGQKSSFYGNDS